MYDLYKKTRENIAEYGSSVIGVMGDRATPSFSYTIGLSEKYGFELIIIGTNPRNGTHFLNYIRDEILGKGTTLAMGEPVEVGATYPGMFQRCDRAKAAEYGIQAMRYYERDDIDFVQVVMPDAEGKFPADPQFDHDYMDERQPLLYTVD